MSKKQIAKLKLSAWQTFLVLASMIIDRFPQVLLLQLAASGHGMKIVIVLWQLSKSLALAAGSWQI